MHPEAMHEQDWVAGHRTPGQASASSAYIELTMRCRTVRTRVGSAGAIDIGRPISGNDVRDAAIVAMMTAHGVSTMLS